MGVDIQKFSLRVVKESGGRYDLDKTIHMPIEAVWVFNEVIHLNKRSEEVCAMITLDVSKNVTGVFEVSIGSVSSSIVTPREVFKRAILQNAKSVILAHNHPSGNVSPSSSDIDTTEKLVQTGKIMDIVVVDHLIIGSDDNYFSMRSEGVI